MNYATEHYDQLKIEIQGKYLSRPYINTRNHLGLMATIYPPMRMWATINISAVYLDILYIANERRHTTIGD